MNTCHLHIGNDSGLGHLAAALNKPTVTIFGPTAPHLWRPAGKKAITVFNPDIECEGGYEHASNCKMQKCLFSIKPKHVADAILASFNMFILPTTNGTFDQVKITGNFVKRKTSDGIVIGNQRTNHYCLVLRGWGDVSPVISEVRKTGSLLQTLRKFPNEQKLLDMLLVHRMVIPAKSEDRSPFL